jgi:hypothetical protein
VKSGNVQNNIGPGLPGNLRKGADLGMGTGRFLAILMALQHHWVRLPGIVPIEDRFAKDGKCRREFLSRERPLVDTEHRHDSVIDMILDQNKGPAG